MIVIRRNETCKQNDEIGESLAIYQNRIAASSGVAAIFGSTLAARGAPLRAIGDVPAVTLDRSKTPG